MISSIILATTMIQWPPFQVAGIVLVAFVFIMKCGDVRKF